MSTVFRLRAFAICLTMVSTVAVTAQEVIDATTAMGASAQLGKNDSVEVIIDRGSTKEDQQTLNPSLPAVLGQFS